MPDIVLIKDASCGFEECITVTVTEKTLFIVNGDVTATVTPPCGGPFGASAFDKTYIAEYPGEYRFCLTGNCKQATLCSTTFSPAPVESIDVQKDPICFKTSPNGPILKGWEIEGINSTTGETVYRKAVDLARTVEVTTYIIVDCEQAIILEDNYCVIP